MSTVAPMKSVVSPTGIASLTEEFSPRTPVPGTPLCFVWNRPPRKFWSDFAVQPVGLTTDFIGATVDIHPKHHDKVWDALAADPSTPLGKPYFQVFSNKFGFVPNLSILDYLFNEGPSL